MWKTSFATLCPLALLALRCTGLPALAAAVEPQADLRALIKNAVATGQSRLLIPPGVYRIGPQANTGIIRGLVPVLISFRCWHRRLRTHLWTHQLASGWFVT